MAYVDGFVLPVPKKNLPAYPASAGADELMAPSPAARPALVKAAARPRDSPRQDSGVPTRARSPVAGLPEGPVGRVDTACLLK